MSRFVRGWASGDHSYLGTPIMMMQSFRQHCIIVRKGSALHNISDLTGRSVGVTGWIDSGNTWTRALLTESGIDLHDVHWVAGRLTAAHPIVDRLSGYGSPGWIEADPQERPMIDMLASGVLDAVMTPFMPPRFFSRSSPFRMLIDDVVTQEMQWYRQHHYVPGIHVLTVRSDIAQQYPFLSQEISRLLNGSRTMWRRRRAKYMDTSPFFIGALIDEGHCLDAGWDDWSLERQQPMIDAFIHHQLEQGILVGQTSVDDMFAH